MSKYFPPRHTWGALTFCIAGFALVGLFINWFLAYSDGEYQKEPMFLGHYEVRCAADPVIVTQLWQQGTRTYYITNGRIVAPYDTDQCRLELQRGNLPQ